MFPAQFVQIGNIFRHIRVYPPLMSVDKSTLCQKISRQNLHKTPAPCRRDRDNFVSINHALGPSTNSTWLQPFESRGRHSKCSDTIQVSNCATEIRHTDCWSRPVRGHVRL